MDYTPISPARMLLAFSLTAMVGIVPVLAIALHNNIPDSIVAQFGGGFGALILGSIALAMVLIGLTWLGSVLGRRVTGRLARV